MFIAFGPVAKTMLRRGDVMLRLLSDLKIMETCLIPFRSLSGFTNNKIKKKTGTYMDETKHNRTNKPTTQPATAPYTPYSTTAVERGRPETFGR